MGLKGEYAWEVYTHESHDDSWDLRQTRFCLGHREAHIHSCFSSFGCAWIFHQWPGSNYVAHVHLNWKFLKMKKYSCMILLRRHGILTENGMIFRQRSDGIWMWILISNIKCIEIFCKDLYKVIILVFNYFQLICCAMVYVIEPWISLGSWDSCCDV